MAFDFLTGALLDDSPQGQRRLGRLGRAIGSSPSLPRLMAAGDDRREPDAPQNAQDAPQRHFGQQGIREPLTPIQAAYDALGPHAQARALQGMAGQAMGAIQDENDSRVAQVREMRRMQHEKDIEAMRQQALIQRLAMLQQAQGYDGEVNNQGLRYNAGGGGMRVFNPNTMSWDYTNQIRAGGY